MASMFFAWRDDRHAGWAVQSLGGGILPARPGGVAGGHGACGEPKIGVGVGGAKARFRVLKAEPMQHLVAVVPGVLDQVTGMFGKPATMGEHVENRDFARHPGVVHGEFGKVVDDFRVSGDRFVADDAGYHG